MPLWKTKTRSSKTQLLLEGDVEAIGLLGLPKHEKTAFNYYDSTLRLPYKMASIVELFKPHSPLMESNLDILDQLGSVFGFQCSSICNQREHLELLLTNELLKKDKKVDQVLDKVVHAVFRNYRKWCKFMKIKPAFPHEPMTQLSLYFLIWGEAGNVRFMPEALCYLYHQAASSLMERIENGHGEQDGYYVRYVLRPLYTCAAGMKTGKSFVDHEHLMNYDDINEFFWTSRCLSYDPEAVGDAIAMSKKSFLEKRSFLNPLLAFYRIYFFLMIMFHVLIVIAYVGYRGNPNIEDGSWVDAYSYMFDPVVEELRTVSFVSIVLSYTGLSIIKCFLEIWMQGERLFLRDPRYAYAIVCRIVWHAIFFGLSTMAVFAAQEIVFSDYVYLDFAWYIFALYFVPIVVSHLIRNKDSCLAFMVSAYDRGSNTNEYIGQNIHQPPRVYWRYAGFWILVLTCKLFFNLHFMIVPLIGPSTEIWDLGRVTVDGAFSPAGPLESNTNLALLLAIWIPVFLVYMYDTQIWFSLLQAALGLFIGLKTSSKQAVSRSQFFSLLRRAPKHFEKSIVSKMAHMIDSNAESPMLEDKSGTGAFHARLRFAVVWNECISSFRLGDLIDDKEAVILQYVIKGNGKVQNPIFLQAGAVAEACTIASDAGRKKWNMKKLHRVLAKQGQLHTLKVLLELLVDFFGAVMGPEDDGLVQLLRWYQDPKQYRNLNSHFKLAESEKIMERVIDFMASVLDLPPIRMKTEIDDASEACYHEDDNVLFVTQNFDYLLKSLESAVIGESAKEKIGNCYFGHVTADLLHQKKRLLQCYKDTSFMDASTRLFLLLSLEKADALPKCQEAQRRISFFLQSLTQKMPKIDSIESMHSFSVITPYYNETVLYSLDELQTKVKANDLFSAVEDSNRNELTILRYLATCHPEEWLNFLERVDVSNMDEALATRQLDVRLWASNRGQTLARTVQGIMMYEDAIKMLRWLEIGSDKRFSNEGKLEQLSDMVALKFSYITSCQLYASQSQEKNRKDIDFLMLKYPNWRVSFVDESSCQTTGQAIHEAVLVKGHENSIVEVYRYELPGDPIIGEGKPENQNIALQFARGQYVQTIDMNQEHYFEETLKMPHFLATANPGMNSSDKRPATILGMREHIFTAKASSLARLMTLQELVFVTLIQRVLANPLRSRMHYGHPDVFDKLFVMTSGGVSKASKGVNLAEDVFSGFNATLRGGNITHHQFMQVGKGRDVSLSQINQFEAKLANGSAECSISRESHRMGYQLDFFRLHSMYYGHMGFYISNALTVFCVFVYAYAKVYVGLHSATEERLITSSSNINDLANVMNTQFIFQFGLLLTVPLMATLFTENKFRVGAGKFLELMITLGPIFYIFEAGTKSYYFDQAMLFGGSKYRGTGRGFVITRQMFTQFFKEYSNSHYKQAVELLALMVIFGVYGRFNLGSGALDDWCDANSCEGTSSNIPLNITLLSAYSAQGQAYGVASFAVWLLGVTWILTPYFYNTDGFDLSKTKIDIKSWIVWMFTGNFTTSSSSDGISSKNDCWTTWWGAERQSKNYSAGARIQLVVRNLRHFFLMIYVFLVDFQAEDLLYLLVGLAIGIIFFSVAGPIARCASRTASSALISGALYILASALAVATITTTSIILTLDPNLGRRKVFTFTVSLISGWYGILNISVLIRTKPYKVVKELAFFFDVILGAIVVLPLLLFSAIPFMSIIQTRMLYNDGFSKALSTSSEYAASISAWTGLAGGFSYGWITCAIYSLGFVNDPSDFFQNTSFDYFLDTVQAVSNFNREYLSVFASLGSVGGCILGGLLMNFSGRRVSVGSGSMLTISGVIMLTLIKSPNLMQLGCIVIGSGLSMLALSIVMYNYEINTAEWRGKGVLIFLLGSFIGFTIEALIISNLNAKSLRLNWSQKPTYDWAYQLYYGIAPLVLLLGSLLYLPESPVWMYSKRRDDKSVETLLMRLRRKHDVFEDMETLREAHRLSNSDFFTTQAPRIGLTILLQCAFAISTSNVLLFRYVIRSGDESTPGGGASNWQYYFGILTLFGILVTIFSIDQIRRKTILKDILPLVSLLAVAVGIFDILKAGDQLLHILLSVLYFATGLSLSSASWLCAIELFHVPDQTIYTPFSFLVYFLVQTGLYATIPSFAIAHFIFAGLCILLVFVLFSFCASDKHGAIRLKKEKAKEKEEQQDLIFNLDDTLRQDSRTSRHSNLRAFAHRSLSKNSNRQSELAANRSMIDANPSPRNSKSDANPSPRNSKSDANPSPRNSKSE